MLLKLVAVVFMLVDHVGLLLFDNNIIMRILGRLSFPIFAFCLSNGFIYTSSVKKYSIRLFVFAVISQIPYMFISDNLNIFFTLLLSLMFLYSYEYFDNKIFSYFLMFYILLMSYFLKVDYGCYGVLLVFLFYRYLRVHYNIKYLLIENIVLTLIYCLFLDVYLQMFSVLSVFLIVVLRGYRLKINKYFYYCFYPVHIVLLLFVRFLF